MQRKRLVLTTLSAVCLAASMLFGLHSANAQIGGFGTSTAGGSGGTPTGPTNFTGIYGSSSSAGSGGIATGSTNFGASGFGSSAAGGSGGRPTGPTNPILPQFGGSPSAGFGSVAPGVGAGSSGGLGGLILRPGGLWSVIDEGCGRSTRPFVTVVFFWSRLVQKTGVQISGRCFCSPHQFAHRAIEAIDRERIHPLGDELAPCGSTG